MGISAHEETLLQLLFNMTIYEVPIYQRNYSWEADQTSALWDDILRTARGSDAYFLGSMVFVKTSRSNVFQILDGQQRFATLSLLMAAFRDLLKERGPGSPFIPTVQTTLSTMDLTGHVVPRLRLNDRDRMYFEPIALDSAPSTPQFSSHKLLSKTYVDFKMKLANLVDDSGQDPNMLWTVLMQTFAERLFVIRIEVDDLDSAQQIFEALNSAGLDLTQADLIKNYILRETPEHARHDAYLTWLALADAVEEDAALTSYIRTYWNSSQGFARKAELYKRIKERVKTPALESGQVSPQEFVTQLHAEVKNWLGIRDANLPGVPANVAPQLRQDLADLRAFNAVLVYVPLLAIRKVTMDSPAEFAKAVRWMRDFFVRHTIVGRRAGNEIEIRFSEWARMLRDEGMSLQSFFDELKRQSPSDDQFEEEFKTLTIRTQRVARIMLARINDRVNPDNVISQTMTEGGSVHLEHIIPQQPDEEGWGATLAEFRDVGLDHEDILNNIGNLTLLRPRDNIGIGNSSFAQRRVAYEALDDAGIAHPAPINEMLTDIVDFGPMEMAKRQAWLAQKAREVWALNQDP
jgi:Protein of unknown function DUF262/Protein of unknown function (DUF1524)